jgi:multiple antibiotic resistance protein
MDGCRNSAKSMSPAGDMFDLFISAFVTLFVVIDPPGCAPIFAGLTSAAPRREVRRMAMRACAIAALVLLVFALIGEQLLGALHIELNSFRIAGGVMLFLIAIEMVFEKRTERREKRAEEILTADEVEDVSVFPLAIPMIAGPGSIATVMLLMSRAEGTPATLVILAALAAVMLLCLLALLAAGPIMRLVGAKAEAVVTRLLGVLLGALAAQYVIDGLRAAFGA